MTIVKVCQADLVTVVEKTPIQEAAKLMKENHVGCLLVMEDKKESQKPIGIMTDRDIVVKILAKTTDFKNITVGEAMSKDLLMLPSDYGIKKSIEAMRDKGVRRAPIIDNDKLVGMVTVDDLLLLMANELSTLADLVERQTSGRK